MADWREIERIRKTAGEFRRLCARLLKLHRTDLDPWELEFLETNVARLQVKEFSTRQAESLLDIRDGVVVVESCEGFSVAALLRQCYEARIDLSEADEEWIVETRAKRPATALRRSTGRLLRLCRQLNILDQVLS